MGKPFHHNPQRIREIPKGEPFVQHSLELITSDAWRYQSIHCRKLIEFLEIEHLNHAGYENGNLMATYSQLEKFGINRRFISKAIDEAEDRGLILVERGMRINLNKSCPNTFMLTYYKYKEINRANNTMLYHNPMNLWKRYKN